MIRQMLVLLALTFASTLGRPSKVLAQTDPQAAKPSVSSLNVFTNVPWKTQAFNQPANVTVTFAGLKTEPRYLVHLPDGSSFLLKSQYQIPNLSEQELALHSDAIRTMVQNYAQALTSDQTIHLAYSEGQSQKSAALTVDEIKLGKIGYTQFDPLSGIFQFTGHDRISDGKFGNALPSNVSRVHFQIPESLTKAGFKTPAPIDVKGTTVKDRLSRMLHFVLDSVIFSTVKAFKKNKSDRDELRHKWDEIGFQFGLKTEALGGLGKLNLSASGGVYWYIGFNKRTYRFVYRRGIRQDKLSDGVGASLSFKAEPSIYRMDSESTYKADPREGYAVIRGETWYPPGLPAGSLSMDTARGFQSDGIAIGPNAVDIGGAFILNTVTSFEEVQRVHSFGLPDVNVWLNSIARQFDFKSAHPTGFGNRAAQIARCEGAFRSTVDVGF